MRNDIVGLKQVNRLNRVKIMRIGIRLCSGLEDRCSLVTKDQEQNISRIEVNHCSQKERE